MKTNVVVGRFQSHKLHSGHIRTIYSALEDTRENGIRGKVIVGVGCTPSPYRGRNPLSFAIVSDMIAKSFPREVREGVIEIIRVDDNRDDRVWEQQLDEQVKYYPNVTMCGSRDSFLKTYTGIFPTKEFPEVPKKSATNIRKKHKSLNKWGNNSAFRRGVIHAVENQFPTAFPTVDMAVICGDKILLGRKPGRDKYCFAGGFVDPTDTCLEDAALRELSEEMTGIQVSPMEYVCSRKIDDFRYKGGPDGIISTLFLCYYLDGDVKAGDDLEEVKWFSINDVERNIDRILTPFHHELFTILYNHLKIRMI